MCPYSKCRTYEQNVCCLLDECVPLIPIFWNAFIKSVVITDVLRSASGKRNNKHGDGYGRANTRSYMVQLDQVRVLRAYESCRAHAVVVVIAVLLQAAAMFLKAGGTEVGDGGGGHWGGLLACPDVAPSDTL